MNAQEIILSPEEQTELSRRVRSATISQRYQPSRPADPAGSPRLFADRDRSYDRFLAPHDHLLVPALSNAEIGRFARQTGSWAGAVCRVLEQVTQPRIGEPRWSCRSMARVAGISVTSAHRLWAANDLKLHLTRTFTLSNDPNFEEKFGDVIGLYLGPSDKALVLYCDEKSQVQALERTQPGLPLWIGHIRT